MTTRQLLLWIMGRLRLKVLLARGQRWHGIGVADDIENDKEAQVWSDRLTTFLFKRRYSARSNFASQLHECYLSLLAFGNCAISVEDMMNGYVRYSSNHIKEHFSWKTHLV